MVAAALPMRYRSYLGAVALNNSAVTLLERGCYSQAMSVLKDSIHAMKTVTVPSAPHVYINAKDAQADEADLEQQLGRMLAKAYKFVTASSEGLSAPTAGGAIKVKSRLYEVDFGTGSATSSPGLDLFSSNVNSKTFTATPIRIETSPCYDKTCSMTTTTTSTVSPPDLESAIILFNFAITQQLFARHSMPQDIKQTNMNMPKREVLLSHALQIAKLSLCTVVKHLTTFNNNNNNVNSVNNNSVNKIAILNVMGTSRISNRQSVLQLQILILRCIHEIHVSLGEEVVAAQVLEFIGFVQSELQHLQQEAEGDHSSSS